MIPNAEGGSRHALRDALVAVLSAAIWGVVAIAALEAGARWAMPALSGPIGDAAWTARTPGWFVADGFFPPEMDRETLHQFSWMRQDAQLVIPALARSQRYRLTFRVAAGRPEGAPPPPEMRVAVDGTVVTTAQTTNEPAVVTAVIPTAMRTGARVTLHLSNSYVPGPKDTRALGVVIDEVTLAPLTGYFKPGVRAKAQAGLATFAMVAGVLLCGLRRRWGFAAGAAVTVALAWLLLQDGAFLGVYIDRLVHIGTGVAIVGVVVAALRARWPVIVGLPEWAIAVGVVLGASAVKLAFFTHPQIARTDAMFQVHRAELVHAGTYFFTSLTPSPEFEFPYAIALYVAALPLWKWFPTELDLANLLRGLALGADALVGVALYAAARRQWQNRAMALLCAALWPFARGPAMALGHANLTNLFGQGFLGMALGVIGWMASGTTVAVGAVGLTGVLLLIAFLSHFSALTIGLLLVLVIAGLFVWRHGRPLRQVGISLLIVTATAVAASYVVYYSHFTEIYRKTFTRVVSGADATSTTSMVAPIATKAQRWIAEDQFSNDYGLPGVTLFLFACLGAVLLVRARRREGWTLVLLSWGFVWIACSALGILTSVEVRATLAAAPMFLCLGAYAIGTLAARSRAGAALAAAGSLLIVWDGLRVWLAAIGR